METEENKLREEVQGIGAYIELRKPSLAITLQFMILPEGYTTTLEKVQSTVYHRNLESHSGRPQWKSTKVANSSHKLGGLTTTNLVRLTMGGYMLAGEPILFEVAKKDFTYAAKGKMPPRINTKIPQLRGTYKYPSSIWCGS